ncbi:MAG: C25 family peptidase propeptide domain-containing protein, partial [Anaerolineae bacterium]
MLLIGLSAWPAASAADVARSDVEVLRSDPAGVVLRIRVPDFRVERAIRDGRADDLVMVPGYALSQAPGRPALPERGILVGIPAGVSPRLTIVHSDRQTMKGFYIRPAATYELADDPADMRAANVARGDETLASVTLRSRVAEDARVYAAADLYPTAAVEIAGTGYLRDQRYVKLLIHPVQYAPARSEIVYHRQLEVRLDFAGDPGAASPAPPRPESAAFTALLRRAIVNYDSAAAWRGPPQLSALRNAAMPLTTPANQTAWKMTISRPGIYQLTYDDLRAAGVLRDQPAPRSFRVYRGATEIPIYVTGEADGAFDPGDRLLFYGQPTPTRYSDASVYWLTVGGADGQRMATRTVSPAGAAQASSFLATIHREQNIEYQSAVPRQPDHDHWFWNYTLAGSVPSRSYTFTLPYPISTPYSATLRLDLAGRTAGAHR